jgi:regulator of ribonuclease activity A
MASTDFSTCDLCDEHENDPREAFKVLPPVFKDYGGLPKFCGPIVTIRALEDNTRVKEAVSSPGNGRVLVVEGSGSLRRALLGGNLADLAAKNGWAGVVVDGAVRDVAELRAGKIGIRALALMPLRSIKRNEGQTDVPVEIQGVPVKPGEWLYADEDGIVISKEKLV